MTITTRWSPIPVRPPRTLWLSRLKSRSSGWAEQLTTPCEPGSGGPAAPRGLVITASYARPVTGLTDTAAMVALARHGRLAPGRLDRPGLARQLLEEQHGLLAQQLVDQGVQDLEEWRRQGIRVLIPSDPEYPENLKAVDDVPPMIFVSGRLERRDTRSVAVIGSRRPSRGGLDRARDTAQRLVRHGYTVVSGLATGIDTAAHTAALAARGRTIAVIGTGLRNSYPPGNRPLQRRIGQEGAVISQFWPDAGPERRRFLLRNALIAGISLASIVVEAGPTSGARAEARFALDRGRPVILFHHLLEHGWARDLAQRSGVHVVRTPAEASALLDGLTEEALAA